MGFYDFVFGYYQNMLDRFEELDPNAISSEELKEVLKEASSLKKFLFDIQEEGYEVTFQEFINKLDAPNRLSDILGKGLKTLGGKTEAELFYLNPEKLRHDFPKDALTKTFELDEYLDFLSSLTEKDVDLSLISNKKWLDKTDKILKEMIGFTRWIMDKGGPNFVFLLRDTLLPYLGLREYEKKGIGIKTVPVMIGRKYLSTFGHKDRLYNIISDAAYDVRQNFGNLSMIDYSRHLKEMLYSKGDKDLEEALSFTKTYLEKKLGQDEYEIIESGVQGTFPLLLSSLSPKIKGFRMYTTVPWLKDCFQDIIYQTNYNYLRDMETLVSQDQLFFLAMMDRNNCYIKEYQDKRLKDMAYYEIIRFKRLLLY